MGTRHLIAVKVDGEYKVAQYGQWDGYPRGQGVGVLNFLRSKKQVAALKENAKTTRWISPEEFEKMWADQGLPPSKDGFVPCADADKFDAVYPELSRDTGSDILKLVASKPGLGLKNSIDFAADSLFCEWAYVIDFDKRTFEVFEGFNTEPVPAGSRFADIPIEKEEGRENKYFHVKRLRVWKLSELPTKRDFLSTLNKLARQD